VPLTEASVDLIFAPAYGTSKKNATDLRMAVDAIELAFMRPEIGVFILLTGDSDFSSCVMKLKEYGKYVIGVGMRESASDLLIQNCDEYYSYHNLSGLTRATDDTGVREDPWELVTKAAQMMARRGDVMRVDRLKQVMVELDPGFSEKDIRLSVTGDVIVIQAERPMPPDAQNASFHRRERWFGRVERAFQLTIPVETSKVVGTYRDGVLTVRLPKAEGLKPREIKIQAG
jgi:HSP20 family molecular chaperone IbpA